MKIPFERGEMRPWKTADLEALLPLADNRAIWRNLRDHFPNPYTRDDARAWIRQAVNQVPCTHFALTVEGKLAGGIGLIIGQDVHHQSAEVGYWLGEPYWGRGIMTEALRAFSNRALEGFDLHRLFALVLEWNPASCRVLEKAGYVLEGRLKKSATKDGRIIDEFLYAKTR